MLREVRSRFLEFFRKKDHLITESASLLPQNDKSILFINSGMAPMKAYFLNEKTPPCKRIANSQRCLRVGGKHNDLSEIGYTKRHHTFFEMLGNFSFGDYFKKEAIEYAWEFLTKELRFDKEKLYVTIHPEDEEALGYWLNFVEKQRITHLSSNVWTMGDTGPWGYCSEIFYDLGEGSGDLESGDRYLEIWNLVFTQFCNDGQNNFNLDFPCIDTGIGLERIVSILEGKKDNYEISFFTKPLKVLKVEHHNEHSKIFLDHLRSTASLIKEGVRPGPSQEGYVLRRLIRRMIRSFSTFTNLNFNTTVKDIFYIWKDTYVFEIEEILPILEREKYSFENTINEGIKKFEEFFGEDKNITAANIFLLHDTYGLTVDIVYDLVRERKGIGDFIGFETLMEKARQKPVKEKLDLGYPDTLFLGDPEECKAKLIGLHDKYLIFDQTVFYAEGGGQVGDTGDIISDNFRAKIIDTIKHGKVYCHQYQLLEGNPRVGELVTQRIDKDRRRRIEAHHSCSHLLQLALERLYGCGVQQNGSYVSDLKFREDFFFPSEIAIDLNRVQNEINRMILEEKDTQIMHMSLSEAKKVGAKAFFEYEDTVRVVKIGDSLELCGGTHVKNTLDIIHCKILKVTSIKSGIKRFECIAGFAYLEYLEEKEALFDEGCRFLQCQKDSFINVLRKVKKEKPVSKVEFSSEYSGIKFGVINGGEEDNLSELMEKNNLDIACLYIEKGLKCNVKIVSKVPSVYSSKEVASKMAPVLEAKGGGGNKEFAQTGGKKQQDLKELYNVLKNYISLKLEKD